VTLARGYQPSHPDWIAACPPHQFGAMLPPASLDRSGVNIDPLMFDNDVHGDCTAVSYTNLARCVAKLNGYDLVVNPSAPLATFAQIVGRPASDVGTEGTQPSNVLEWQNLHGFDIGPQRLTARYGVVKPERIALAHATACFGGAWLGAILHERDEENFLAGRPWDYVDGRDDGPITGGHMVNTWAYTGLGDADTVLVGTWATWHPVTWAWLEDRTMEAFGLVWRQLARADGGFYDGVDADGLVRELAA
jgi:hypothetical protein